MPRTTVIALMAAMVLCYGASCDDRGSSIDDGGIPTQDAGPEQGDHDHDAGVGDAGNIYCHNTADCSPEKWCDINNNVCRSMGTCNSDWDCAATFFCNTSFHVCECMTDEACVGWPDGKTSCDPETFRCVVPEHPPCPASCELFCQECVDGFCQIKAGMDCCDFEDCKTPPRTVCDRNEYKCVECLDDSWCGYGYACDAASHSCMTMCNPPCDVQTEFCSEGPPAMCKAREPKLCTPCITNDDCATPDGDLVCPVFLPRCTRPCGGEACEGRWCHGPSHFCDCSD